MTRARFTVERRSTPLDYRGINHSRITEDMEELPGTPLKMVLRLRRLIGDHGRVRIAGGVRGAARYFGWDAPNGRLQEYLNLLQERGYIDHAWTETSDLIITVLPPAGASDPTRIATTPIAEQAPASHPTATKAVSSGDPPGITMNHDQNQGVGGDAPTALLSPQQLLLFNALLAAKVSSKTHALQAVQALPDCTINDFRDQVAYAQERNKEDPIAFVIWLWSQGRQFRRPPRKEATSPQPQKGQTNEVRRTAPGRSAPHPQRTVSPDLPPRPPLKRATIGRWGAAPEAGSG